MKKIIIFVSFVLLFSNNLFSQWTVKTVPDPKTTGSGFVSNPESLITQSTVDSLNKMIKTANDSGYIQIAVVVLNSIGEKVPKEFATELFNFWKIGDKEKNNGLLVLLVMDQRRVEFETGYGIEAVLTDAVCYQIQQDFMVPYFKQNDYNSGVLEGVRQTIYTVSQDTNFLSVIYDYTSNDEIVTENYNYQNENFFESGFFRFYVFIVLIVLFIFILVLVSALLVKDYYKRYNILKPFTFLLFPILLPLPFLPLFFIIKKLMERWRETPRISQKGKIMRKLDEKQDDKYLSSGQVSEEKVKSVDYDVWICEETGEILVLAYKRWFTSYSQCPKCGFKTYNLEYDRVTSEATYTSDGEGERKYSCANCHHSVVTRYVIPQKQETSSTSSNYSGGSSWGGSSSFGSDSWGGGSSGGGGAGSSW